MLSRLWAKSSSGKSDPGPRENVLEMLISSQRNWGRRNKLVKLICSMLRWKIINSNDNAMPALLMTRLMGFHCQPFTLRSFQFGFLLLVIREPIRTQACQQFLFPKWWVLYKLYIVCEASVSQWPGGWMWTEVSWRQMMRDRARTFNTYSLHTHSTLFLISSDDSLCYLQMKVKEDEDDTAGYSLYYNGFHKRNSAMAEGIYIFPLSIQWCFQDILNDQQDLYFRRTVGPWALTNPQKV